LSQLSLVVIKFRQCVDVALGPAMNNQQYIMNITL